MSIHILAFIPVIFPVYLPARDIRILRGLFDEDVTERESVSFTCEVNLEDVDGQWYINSSRLKPGDNVKIKHEGKLKLIQLPLAWLLVSCLKVLA